MKSKEQKEQIKRKHTHSHRVQTDSRQREVVGGWVKTGKGVSGINWQLQNGRRGVDYSIGSTVHDTVITIGG